MPKCTILSPKVKNCSGEGAQPPPQALPLLGRGHPSPNPTPLGAPYLPTPQLFFSQFSHRFTSMSLVKENGCQKYKKNNKIISQQARVNL